MENPVYMCSHVVVCGVAGVKRKRPLHQKGGLLHLAQRSEKALLMQCQLLTSTTKAWAASPLF